MIYSRRLRENRPAVAPSLVMVSRWIKKGGENWKGLDIHGQVVGFNVPVGPGVFFLIPLREYPPTIDEYYDRANGKKWKERTLLRLPGLCDDRAQEIYSKAVKNIKELDWIKERHLS